MSTDTPDFAPRAAVAGLAREVEALRRAVDRVVPVTDRVEELAALIARVAEDVAAGVDTGEGVLPLSWLDFAEGATDAEVLLGGLAEWIGAVYLRYADAAQVTPACWLWHPDVVEELLWLMRAWLAAYRKAGAPVSAAADWHDRLRPGVVRRIKATAGTCSLENHQPSGDRHTAAPSAPVAGAAGMIAAWWATSRNALPPTPTDEHLAAAAAVRTRGGRK